MNLTEYILLSREERTAHIDLTTPCEFNLTEATNKRCPGGKAKPPSKAETAEFFDFEDDVENWNKAAIARCHLCEYGSPNGWCANPLHYYVGTKTEDALDMPVETRTNRSRNAGTNAVKTMRRERTGWFDSETQRELGKKGGKIGGPRGIATQRELGVGWFNPEHQKRVGKLGAFTSLQKWISLADGYINNAGNVAKHNRQIGASPDARIRLDDLEAPLATFAKTTR